MIGLLICFQYNFTNVKVFLTHLDPPDQPTIKGLSNTEPIRMGETRRLICECLNGHPPPELQWIKSLFPHFFPNLSHIFA